MALLLTTSTTSWAADDDRARAIELAKKSSEAYGEGRFREAAKLLEAAYALDPAPTLLFNLARSLESAGDLELAVKAYERYLRSDPDAKGRGAIEKRIANMNAQLSERARLAEERDRERRKREAAERARKREAEIVTPKPDPQASTNIAPWLVSSVGAAGVIAGVALGVLSNSRHDTAAAESVQQNAMVFQDEAKSFALGANIAYAAGGTVLVTGLIWGIMSLLDDGPTSTTALLTLQPGRFNVGWGF